MQCFTGYGQLGNAPAIKTERQRLMLGKKVKSFVFYAFRFRFVHQIDLIRYGQSSNAYPVSLDQTHQEMQTKLARLERLAMKINNPEKVGWQGTIVSIQPRTNVWRYRLDNRTHYLCG